MLCYAMLSFGAGGGVQCARTGKWDRGAEILERMKGSPCAPPDARTYAKVIEACAKGEQWEQAIRYLDEMREVGIS